MRKNGFGACLADDMGLGKTLQIIAFLSDESLNKTRNLIIVPKTLLLNWKREIRKFSPNTSMYYTMVEIEISMIWQMLRL